MLKFKLLYQLQDTQLDYLASRALSAEYDEEETIVPFKTHPMDKLYLVLEGSVVKYKEF